MKTSFGAVPAALGMILLGAAFSPTASAGCGGLPGKPSASIRQDRPFRFVQAAFRPGLFVQVGYDDEPIVGMWQVTFTAKGNGTAGPPDGTPLDAGYQTWHSDGTELHNSGARDPSTGDFCMGVWKRIGYSEYKLNHWTLSWVTASPTCTPAAGNIGCFLGPGNIQEDVIVDETGNNFSGTFTIVQYDQHGNKLATVVGTITGTRVTVD